MTPRYARSRGIGFSAGNFPTSRAKGAREVGHPGSCSTTVREKGRSLAPLVKTRGLRDDAWFQSFPRDWIFGWKLPHVSRKGRARSGAPGFVLDHSSGEKEIPRPAGENAGTSG